MIKPARRVWRSRRSRKKQLLVTRLTCCFIVNSASRWARRSRTTSTGMMISSPTDKVRFVVGTSSVLPVFSCSRREAHQHAADETLTSCINVGNRSRRIKLLIASKQMMMHSSWVKHHDHIFSVRDEFNWSRNRSLWDTAKNRTPFWLNTIDTHWLSPVGQIRNGRNS